MKFLRVLFKIYAVSLGILLLFAAIGVATQKSSTLVDDLDILLSLPSILALIALAWSRRIASRTIWATYAVIFIVGDLAYNFTFHWSKNVAAWDQSVLGSAISSLLVVSVYVATLLYALRFNQLGIKR